MIRRQKVRAVMLVVLAMIASVFTAVIQVTPAQAATTEVATLTDIKVGAIQTHGNGMITLNQCGQDPAVVPMIKTIDSLGNTVAQIERPSSPQNATLYMCESGTVARDGTIFATKGTSVGSNVVMAYKNDILLWERNLGTCSQSSYSIQSMILGTDGDLYVVANAGCGTVNSQYLYGIGSQDGHIKFKVLVTTDAGNPRYLYPRFAAHPGGIVFYDEPRVRYFDYNGLEDVEKTYILPTLPSGQSVHSHAFNAQGDVFFAVRQVKVIGSPNPCIAQQDSTATVIRHGTDGATQYYDLSSVCLTPPSSSRINATPSGGVVFLGTNIAGAPVDKLVNISANGNVLATIIPTTGLVVGFSKQPISYRKLQVDLNGNVILPRSGTRSGGDQDQLIQILVYDAAGNQTFNFSTDEIGTPNREYFYVVEGGSAESKITPFGLSQGAIHVAICTTATQVREPCNMSMNPQKLYKIDVPNLTINYPRGAILGFQPGVAVRKMAVVGDSFISGEGVEAFLPGTDTAGPPENRCHRSKNAYALKLDYDPQVNANLVAFPACSGATSLNLHGAGQWNEPKQLDSVPSDTQVIVLSIGGNDSRLFQAISSCSTTIDAHVCEAALVEVDDNIRASWFRDRIKDAFAAIRAKAPNARVIVVGYPHIVGTVGEDHCGWLAHDITPLEVSLVDSIGVGLNSILSQEAAIAEFTYLSTVETFSGHKVCDEEPFAHSVVPANPGYSYHPNAAGLTALYTLLKTELA